MNDLTISPDIVDEIRQLFVEGEFNHRWMLIETYHRVGEIICGIKRNRQEVLQGLAPQVNKSVRSLTYAAKLYETYPSLDDLPEGKNISWNKIVHKYLTANSSCEHKPEEIEIISFQKCKSCGKHLGKA